MNDERVEIRIKNPGASFAVGDIVVWSSQDGSWGITHSGVSDNGEITIDRSDSDPGSASADLAESIIAIDGLLSALAKIRSGLLSARSQ